MSYTALYRKYRPAEFEDVKGQEHIVTTLKNQIKADRIGHAYLFCGTRGTGKTTVAKIFAKAVNCENPIDGSPCGECPTCKAIASGTSMNVIEIDAASNNGVENIRQIRDEVSYSPTEGKYKVYIIDEVHMLSIGAFNALLKTLEEPPAYVIFILATTESHKIPITILSRCQKYDFRRITIDTISDRLMELMDEEQVEYEEKAIRYIAKAGDGSMRDSLSLLDQCIAFYMNEKLTYEHVLEVLGAVDTEVFSRLLRAVIANDVVGCISVLEELIIQGRELGQFVTDFVWYLRNLLLIKSSDRMEEVLDMSKENLALLKEEAAMLDPEVIMRYIRIFSELSGQIKYAPQKRVLIEIALIKLCRPSMERDQESLIDRVAQLERRVENGVFVQGTPAAAPLVTGTAASTPTPAEATLPKAVPGEIQQVIKNWNSIKADVPGGLHIYLNKAIPTLSGDSKLMLVFEDDMAYSYVAGDAHKAEIEAAIANRIGKTVEVIVKMNDTGRPTSETYVDLLSSKINMEIEEFEDD